MDEHPKPPPLPENPDIGKRKPGRRLNTWIIVLVILACLSVPVLAILAGLLLPALAQAKGKAQEIQCMNNLKQLGMACRLYASENEDKLPKSWDEIETEIGGVQNLRVFICTADKNIGIPRSFAEAAQSSSYFYELPGGVITNAQAVITQCPIHGHVLRVDGSVMQGRRGRRQ